MSELLFSLGRVVLTPGALDAFAKSAEESASFLRRHVTGDWGELDPHDQAVNRRALQIGDRIFSCYRLKDSVKFYIITEHDRSVTTLLLPEEY